jgi:hypothetical protein
MLIDWYFLLHFLKIELGIFVMTITKMAPSNPIDLLQQMSDEYYVIATAQSVTEDMLKAYRNNCDNPVSSIGLLADIQQFEYPRFMQFAKWTRNMYPTATDLFMRSNGYYWEDAGYFC